MNAHTLTEELPSSGSKTHEHTWQKVEGGGNAEHDMVVCKHENCDASKLVKKPKVVESKSEKQLLLG